MFSQNLKRPRTLLPSSIERFFLVERFGKRAGCTLENFQKSKDFKVFQLKNNKYKVELILFFDVGFFTKYSYSSISVRKSVCNVQGVRKKLPDPFICKGFHSFLCSVSNKGERESCSLGKYCTSVQLNAYTVT